MGDLERKSEGGTPPTFIMQAYQGLDAESKKRFQGWGARMIAVGVILPMAIEPFIQLSWVYWGFSLVVIVIGVCLAWLPAGVWLGNLLASLTVKLVPRARDKLMPERRSAEEGAER